MAYFALCHGLDLSLCRTCQRHAELNPAAAADPHQQFISPQADGVRCRTWKPMPPAATPRVDTGD